MHTFALNTLIVEALLLLVVLLLGFLCCAFGFCFWICLFFSLPPSLSSIYVHVLALSLGFISFESQLRVATPYPATHPPLSHPASLSNPPPSFLYRDVVIVCSLRHPHKRTYTHTHTHTVTHCDTQQYVYVITL